MKSSCKIAKFVSIINIVKVFKLHKKRSNISENNSKICINIFKKTKKTRGNFSKLKKK